MSDDKKQPQNSVTDYKKLIQNNDKILKDNENKKKLPKK